MPSRAAECAAETTAETFRLETKRRKLKRGTLRERENAAEASREVVSVHDRVDASRDEGERHACTRLCACTIEPQRGRRER
jgi:hypothetical protein